MRRYAWELPGILYIIATPIGNLEDITYRAVRILAECGVIACEDTRQTRKLLDHYGIRAPMVSFHEHNEAERAVELCERMEGGGTVALVSDAGTPLISDPGYRLVSAALERGIRVVPIPGPSAAMTALSASGLTTDCFLFGGFLSPKTTQRRAELAAHRDSACTLIYYEAPHRIIQTLDDIGEILPERPVVLARELTKVHEEFLRGTAAEIAEELRRRPSVQGEFTLLLGKPSKTVKQAEPSAVVASVESRLQQGVPRMEAMKAAAREFGISKGQVYRYLTGSSG